jgi:hypothetical protein
MPPPWAEVIASGELLAVLLSYVLLNSGAGSCQRLAAVSPGSGRAAPPPAVGTPSRHSGSPPAVSSLSGGGDQPDLYWPSISPRPVRSRTRFSANSRSPVGRRREGPVRFACTELPGCKFLPRLGKIRRLAAAREESVAGFLAALPEHRRACPCRTRRSRPGGHTPRKHRHRAPTLPPLRPHRPRPVPGGGSRRRWLTRRGSRPCEMPGNVPGCMNVGGPADSAGCGYGAPDGPTGLIRSEMSEKSSWGMVKSPRRNGSPQWLGSLTKES